MPIEKDRLQLTLRKLLPMPFEWKKDSWENHANKEGFRRLRVQDYGADYGYIPPYVVSVVYSNGDIVGLSIFVDSFPSVENGRVEGFENDYEESILCFESTIQAIQEIFGFMTNRYISTEEDFPDDESSLMVARWDILNFIIRIEILQDEQDAPFTVLVSVAPN